MPCMLSLYSSQLSSLLWPNHPSIQTPSPAPPGVKWPPSRRQNIRHLHVSSAEKEPRTPLPLPSPPPAPPRVSAGCHKLNLGLYKTFSRELWMQFETYFVSILDRKNVQSIRRKIGKHLLEPFFFRVYVFFFFLNLTFSSNLCSFLRKVRKATHLIFSSGSNHALWDTDLFEPTFCHFKWKCTESSGFMSFLRIFYAKRM